jgi:peroxiredoxin
MSVEQLRDALITGSSGYLPGDEPTQERLVRGLFSSEVGSLGEGPGIGQEAPDFALRTQDGSKVIHLKDEIGKRPVVLVFGNFTCGPFRRNFPEVEDIHQHYKGRATFIGVYVREAHPSDGWMMESNTQNGVSLAQPKTYDERKAVAQRCATTLRYSMPLLVDEIDDPVGNAYSGMPSRMYVIDKDGIVTYKSGRGPFGFKIGEMEQALALTLLNTEQPAKKGE